MDGKWRSENARGASYARVFQSTLQQLSYGTASPLRGFAACAFPASPYVAIKRASRVSSVVSVNSRNPRSLFILHRKGFVHCPQPFTADIVRSTMVICDERWTAASCYSGSGIHLGNLKSGRKESRVCFGNRTMGMRSGAATMQEVRVTPGLGTGCLEPLPSHRAEHFALFKSFI